ncbi:MAG: hemolysin family protein [Myxococcota bacterium]
MANAARRVLAMQEQIEARYHAGRITALALASATTMWVWRDDTLPEAIAAVLLVALGYGLASTTLATVARRRASRIALRLSHWLRPLELMFAPLALPSIWMHRWVRHTVPPVEEPEDVRVTELAVEQVIEEGEENGSIGVQDAELLRSILEFKKTYAREVMVPRTQTVAIAINTPVDKVLELIVKSGHSRYPVYRDRIDRIEGVLYAKDLFQVVGQSDWDDVRLEHLVRRPVYFTPENRKIGMLLREMQSDGVHLAIVVDEFGGVSGIVTLEDVLEEIVGEIRDEHDSDEIRLEEVEPGRYLADAGMSVYDLNDMLGESLDDGEGGALSRAHDSRGADSRGHDSRGYDSLGGLIIEIAGRVPRVGDTLHVGNYRLKVTDADERRVIQVELTRSRLVPAAVAS